MSQQTRTAWIVAAVLGIIALGLLAAIVHEKSANNVGSRYYVRELRSEIRDECGSTDAADRANCESSLKALSDLLEDVDKDIRSATTTDTVQ